MPSCELGFGAWHRSPAHLVRLPAAWTMLRSACVRRSRLLYGRKTGLAVKCLVPIG
jgi:hypothetical protein